MVHSWSQEEQWMLYFEPNCNAAILTRYSHILTNGCHDDYVLKLKFHFSKFFVYSSTFPYHGLISKGLIQTSGLLFI